MTLLPAQILPATRRARAAASALLVAIMVMSVLVVIAAVAFDYTGGNGRFNNRSRTYFSAQTVAESGLEKMYADWRNMLVDNPNLFPSTTQLRAGGSNSLVAPPDATDHPGFANYTFTNFDIRALNTFYVPLTDLNAAPLTVQAPAAGRPGWTSNSRNYLATATVKTQGFGASTDVNSTLEMIFTQQSTSIFQAAIFYQDEMEIHPGPAFTVTGLVHSNGNIYAAHNSLTFGGNVSFVGSLNNNFMSGDSRLGTETPTQYNKTDDSIQFTKVDPLEPIADDPSSVFNTTDANLNNDSYREMIEIPATGAGQADPPQVAGIRMFNKAALKVRIKSVPGAKQNDPPVTVVDVYRKTGPALAPNDPLYKAVNNALTLDQPITNKREGTANASAAVVDLDTIDVSKLNTAIKQMNDAARPEDRFNGVLYIADERVTDSDPKAIRLKNGSVLPDGTNSAGSQASTVGLTVASENSIYIQGDYNTGTSTPSQVPSNVGDLTRPQIDNYTRKPAAVMGDAVNILSNSWDDSKSTLGMGARVASNTTINTAIMAGNVPTNYNAATGKYGAEAGPAGNGRYSGGVENFPRFLEDWGNKRLTYYGSMVQMFISKHETGPWGSANVYNAPNRNWYFDELFRQNPPPGFVNFPNFSKGRWARK